ncbi:MAG: hypothetical protein EOP04_22420, partial [Proteobacteria bacterium]
MSGRSLEVNVNFTNQENDERFPEDVHKVLLESGWYPGRQIPEQELENWYVRGHMGPRPSWSHPNLEE